MGISRTKIAGETPAFLYAVRVFYENLFLVRELKYNPPKSIALSSETPHMKRLTTILPRLFLLPLLLAASLSAVAGPADLDPTFGTFGKVISSPDGSNQTWGNGIAVQADGKIIMSGESGAAHTNIMVARYNADGSLDTGFGSGGFVLIPFTSVRIERAGVVIQPDGKIVVAATVYTGMNPAVTDIGVARLHPDGSLDTSFDGDGKAIIDFNEVLSSTYAEHFTTIKLAGDGKIVIGAQAYAPNIGTNFVFAKLNTNGSPDTTFGTNGKFADQLHPVVNFDTLKDIAVLPNGQLVAVGYLVGPSAGGNYRIAFKINAAGTGREWTYQQGALGSAGIGQSFNAAVALPDGKVIVVGRYENNVTAWRFNTDGTLDFSFANPSGTPNGQANAVALQADGKIVVAVSGSFYHSFSVVRFNSNGTLDSTFGGNGLASGSLLGGGDNGLKVVIQTDGKILVGGTTQTLTQPFQYYFGMVRYRGGNFVPDGRSEFDYDGDNRADVSVFRPSDGTWYINRSTAGYTTVGFGNASDRIVPADYDGDLKADVAIYRDGQWWILQSSNSTVRVYTFGIAEDTPQPGDYDGDDMDDIAVFRPSTSTWYVLRSTDGGFHAVPFGAVGDVPQRGDYDDDGKTDFALFRPSNGNWYIQRSTGGYLIVKWGVNGDKPVASDYDGDNKPDIAVWRPTPGDWYVLRSSDSGLTRRNFGVAGDIPVPADYDGDGRSDIAVFRPSTGFWYQLFAAGGQSAFPFGVTGDRPTPSAYVP